MEHHTPITRNTRISDILDTYGDIAEVMELFGIQRIKGLSLRMLAARALTVEWAARIHRVPLDEFLSILNRAVASQDVERPSEPSGGQAEGSQT